MRANISGEKDALRDEYEELRRYAISPVKTPSRPIGLDLWLKKGFLAWIAIILCKDLPQTINKTTHDENNGLAAMQSQNTDIPLGLIISLSNILMKWSDNNGGQQSKEGAFNP